MKTVKPQRLGVLHRVVGIQGQSYLTVATLAFFEMGPQLVLGAEAAMWTALAEELPPGTVLDECLPKSRAEVLVCGHCYPPGGEQPASYVRVSVSGVDKTVAVIGDREWRDGVPTQPQAFSSMPITWSRAFGGGEFSRNPIGIGADSRRMLPNLEDPARLIRSPRERPEPTCLYQSI